jgi:hypothetical protein
LQQNKKWKAEGKSVTRKLVCGGEEKPTARLFFFCSKQQGRSVTATDHPSDPTMGGSKSKVAPHPARERVSTITTTGGPAVGNAVRSSGSNQREAPVLSAAAASVQPSQTLQLEAEVQRLTTALTESKAQLQVLSRHYLRIDIE